MPDCEHYCHLSIKLAILVLIGVGLLAAAGCGDSMDSDPSASATAPPSGSTGDPPAVVAADGSLNATMGTTQAGMLTGKGTGTLTYMITDPPQDGTATLTDAATGTFSYTPYPNYTGSDSFQFTVKNGADTSQPATEAIHVFSGALGAEQAVANVGVSLDWLCYWCVVQPYVDITHQAAPFGDPKTGVPLAEENKLDSNGWPEADFRWMVICCIKADGSRADPGLTSPLAGAYHLSFNGKATISPLTFQLSNQQYDPATNTTTATLTLGKNYQGGNAMLSFKDTERTGSPPTGTGVTNIRIIRPQFAPNGMKWWDSPTQEFTQPFLDSLKGFSTVRYINWTKVIGSPEVNWSDRTPGNWPVASHRVEAAPTSLKYLVPPPHCTQYCDWYSTGASWKSAIDVANASHTDMWINIPVMATDDYVKSLAALIKSKLDPGLHVYVEWSDEIWNYGNPYWTETNYNLDQTKALLASSPTAATNYATNCHGASAECHVAERVMQLGKDFASVYGASAIPDTIRPVLCTQVVQPVYLQAALKYITLTYGPPKNYFYGTCGAPYWGASKLPAGTTTAGAVAAIDAGIPNNDSFIRADTATDLFYGLHNLTYEGGPSNVSFAVDGDTNGTAAKALEASVQMAPGMKADVINGLTNAFANGIDMYMYYENQSATYWGATVDPLDLDAPKFAGLTASADQLVTRNVGTTLPATISANPPDFTIQAGAIYPWAWPIMFCRAGQNGAPGSCSLKRTATPGTGFAYLVDVPKAGTYSFSLVMNVGASSPGGSIALEVDQKLMGNFTVAKTSSGTPQTAGPVSVTFTSGLHLIEILQIGAYHFSVSSITVTGNN